MSKRSRAYAYLMTTTIIWGLAGVVIKTTLDYLPPATFLFYRYVINLAVFGPIFLVWKQKQSFHLSHIIRLLLLGAMLSASLLLIFFGFQKTSAVEGVFLSSLSPIFVVAGGAWLLKEHISRREKIGFLITVVGALIITFTPIFQVGINPFKHLEGNLMTLMFSIIYALYFIASKYLLNHKHQPMEMVFFTILGGLIIFWPLAVWEQSSLMAAKIPINHWLERLPLGFYALGQVIKTLPSAGWVGLLYMALLSTLVANWTNIKGLKLIEASEATVFTYLQPVVTLPAAFLILGESLSLSFAIGALITAWGIYVVEKR